MTEHLHELLQTQTVFRQMCKFVMGLFYTILGSILLIIIVIVVKHKQCHCDNNLQLQLKSSNISQLSLSNSSLDQIQRPIHQSFILNENKTKQFDWTCLHYAAANGSFDIVQNIVEKDHRINVTAQTPDGETALDLALNNNRTKIVGYLIEARINQDGWTMLHEAAANDDLSNVKLLIENNANLFAQTFQGKKTALDLATQNGWINVSKLLRQKMFKTAIEQNNLDFIHQIASDPHFTLNDAADERGWTPLHLAARMGKLNIVKILVGALINGLSSDGQTALEMAKDYDRDEVVKFLDNFN